MFASPIHTCSGTTSRYLLLVALLWIFTGGKVEAQILADCGYYKLPKEVFSSLLHKLVDDIAQLANKRPAIEKAILMGSDITDYVYRAGLIKKIPGCNHSNTGPNIQIVGGNTAPIAPVTGSKAIDGFTLIIKALPYRLCAYIGDTGANNRGVWVRFEPPNSQNGKLGECVNNPILPLLNLGQPLPEPNTAYVFQPLLASAPKTPGQSTSGCQPTAKVKCCRELKTSTPNSNVKGATKIDNALAIIKAHAAFTKQLFDPFTSRGLKLQLCRMAVSRTYYDPWNDQIFVGRGHLNRLSQEETIRVMLEELAHAAFSTSSKWPPAPNIAKSRGMSEFNYVGWNTDVNNGECLR